MYTIDNHFCLLPVTIPFKGQPLRSKDPLPCPGLKSFHEASTHLKRLCSFLQTPCPNVHSFITPSQFPKSGDLRTMVLTIAETLSKVAIVRAADKGAAMLWGFCAAWVWDNVDRFLTSENYTPLPLSSSNAVKGNLSSAIQAHHWPLNKNASIPLLYILAKAKSLSKQMIVWRPIAAVVQSFILRHWLRLAARAFTLFLKTLVSELPACFLHLRITDLAEWVSALPSWKCQVIGEADCTQQFDKVPPTSIVDSLKEAGTWLRKKKQWRAHETVWSNHKDNPAHDRSGMGQHTRFEYITHQQFEALVEFSTKDIYAQAAGQLWCRSPSIPMGGPFSAQGADLHSVWQAKKKCHFLRRLGTLRFSETLQHLWDTPRGNTVSLAQFRDNILTAATGPTCKSEMAHVCSALTQAWGLPVICPCITPTQPTCTQACMSTSTTAMGININVREGCGAVTTHAQPSGLTDSWSLKYCPTMQSPWSASHRHVRNIMTGSIVNALPFLNTWSSMLLSFAAWIQLSSLSSYPKSAIHRALQGAVPRLLSPTPWDISLSLFFCRSILPLLPCDKSRIMRHLTTWLRIHAVWQYSAYTSWHLPSPTVVMPIALSGAMITPSSNKCVASPRGDTDGRWQSQWPCHSLKYRDRSRVHNDSLAVTSVYRCHTL